MIEVIAARSGDRTISLNGKLLASKIDPRSEAEKWCEKFNHSLRGIRSAIVLGAGVGYHLGILKKRFPHLNIVCVETNSELISHIKASIETSLLGIDFISFKNLEKLFEEDLIRSALAGSYQVLVHPSLRMQDADLAEEILLQLNGRKDLGLRTIIEIREGLKVELKEPESGLYSINDLLLENRSYHAARELLK